uniref:Uncharacterized protein n=1 Tax=Arundo donax TaxID=35708 RepID=A0A0A9DR13_ARUDO
MYVRTASIMITAQLHVKLETLLVLLVSIYQGAAVPLCHVVLNTIMIPTMLMNHVQPVMTRWLVVLTLSLCIIIRLVRHKRLEWWIINHFNSIDSVLLMVSRS